MNKQLRNVVWVIAGCFVLLFAQLNRIQVFEAEALQDNQNNTRKIQREFDRERGRIITRDGTVVAFSEPVADSTFSEQRKYPHGNLYAHTVGYISFTVGADGVERFFSSELIGDTSDLAQITDEIRGRASKQDVVLTLDHVLQTTAQEALGNREGSVVALDPRSGELLALWSFPSYDPTPLVSHDGSVSSRAFRDLAEAESDPLLAKTTQEIYFPGSTFKVVTASAALETGGATLEAPVFEQSSGYELPLSSSSLRNFGGSTCGGNLVELLVVSCNTGFAELAVEQLGPEAMSREAEKYGFNQELPFDLRPPAVSEFPTDYGTLVRNPTDEIPAGIFENSAKLAQTSIGQNSVSATPLQMALVAAAVANQGEVPTPHVVKEIRETPEVSEGSNTEADGPDVVEEFTPDSFSRAMSAESAEQLGQALVETAERGSAKNIAVSGVEIGAKTGTAQIGTEPKRSHAWIIAYAGPPGQEPEIAIAVLVKADPSRPEQTGGSDAAPIARAVIERYFDRS